MQKMKKDIGLLLMIVMLMLGGCQSEMSGDDPLSVLQHFFNAMAKKDITEARKYTTSDSKSLLDMMETISKFDSSSSIETSRYLNENIEFGKAKIVGKEAIVEVKSKTDGETMSFNLVQEDGEWKVAFDLNTILTIGMQKMKQNGLQNTNQLKDALNELNKVGVDSLKKGADAEMQKLDDALKSLQIDSIQ
jgi:hypothetical protein